MTKKKPKVEKKLPVSIVAGERDGWAYEKKWRKTRETWISRVEKNQENHTTSVIRDEKTEERNILGNSKESWKKMRILGKRRKTLGKCHKKKKIVFCS